MPVPRFLIGYSACPLTLTAFEEAGVEAWTCDFLPSRGRPDRHLQCDVWEVANDRWDGALFHPMCSYLTTTAAWAFLDPDFERFPGVGYHQKVKDGTLTGQARREARDEAVENFRRLLALPYPKAIENPARSFIGTAIRPPDQTLQPYKFGDDASKATGLWIDRLPKLRPTGWVEPRRVPREQAMGKSNKAKAKDLSERVDLFGEGLPRWSNQSACGQDRTPPSDDRWLKRSETFPGIARAMGSQWGAYLMRLPMRPD